MHEKGSKFYLVEKSVFTDWRKMANQISDTKESITEFITTAIIPAVETLLAEIQDAYNPEEPETSLYEINLKVKEKIGALFQGCSEVDVRERLIQLADLVVADKKLDDLFTFPKSAEIKGKEIRMLKRVFYEANQNEKFAGTFILSLRNPMAEIKDEVIASANFEEIENSTGEHKARVLMEAWKVISERLYRPYLFYLIRLRRISKGKKLSVDTDQFANMVREAEKLYQDYPSLIVDDAVQIRNAAAHHTFDYLPTKRAVRIRDQKKQPIILRVDELYEKTMAFYRLVGPMFREARTEFVVKTVYFETGLIRVVFANFIDAISEDPDTAMRANQRVEKCLEGYFASVNRFLDKIRS